MTIYLLPFTCAHCGKHATQKSGAVNRARKDGKPLYCDQKCAGLSRRGNKTKAQKVAEKRLYDEAYRARNFATLKAKKALYFQATYDLGKARIERKKRMRQHVEYCRRPEYKAWKSAYDRWYRAVKQYGEYAEAALALGEIEQEIGERMTRTEVYTANGTLNKRLTRRREYESFISG